MGNLSTSSAKKDKIIFIGHGASRTGAPKSLLNTIKWFSANTHHSFILILGKGGPLVTEYKKYTEVKIWGEKRQPPRNAKSILRAIFHHFIPGIVEPLNRHQRVIIDSLKRDQIGCIFNNTGVNGQLLGVLKSEFSAPILSRIPELEAYMRINNVNGSIDKVLACSDYFIAPSQAVKKNLVNNHHIASEQVHVIYGACDTQRRDESSILRKKLGLRDDAILVGGCGTMEWRKGFDLFIQTANTMVNHMKIPDIYFCWIGGHVSKSTFIEYQYELELLNLTSNFFILGEVPDTAPYLAALNVFLLTSREDPFPLVMLEAARQAIPIVCFEESGGASEFVDETIGLRVPMLDIKSLAYAIKNITADPKKRASLGLAAYRKSLLYSPERMGSDIYDVVSSAMNSAISDE